MDRRAVFFVIAAVACLALVPATEGPLRWVPGATGTTYLVLALASWLDARNYR